MAQDTKNQNWIDKFFDGLDSQKEAAIKLIARHRAGKHLSDSELEKVAKAIHMSTFRVIATMKYSDSDFSGNHGVVDISSPLVAEVESYGFDKRDSRYEVEWAARPAFTFATSRLLRLDPYLEEDGVNILKKIWRPKEEVHLEALAHAYAPMFDEIPLRGEYELREEGEGVRVNVVNEDGTGRQFVLERDDAGKRVITSVKGVVCNLRQDFGRRLPICCLSQVEEGRYAFRVPYGEGHKQGMVKILRNMIR